MSDTQSPKRSQGRPKVHNFDYEQILRMAELMMTTREICHVLGCSESTSRRDQKFKDAVQQGNAHGKMRLRRAMFKNACERMSAPVQIFLAKNILGMSDDGMRDDEGNQPLPWVENPNHETETTNNDTDQDTTNSSE